MTRPRHLTRQADQMADERRRLDRAIADIDQDNNAVGTRIDWTTSDIRLVPDGALRLGYIGHRPAVTRLAADDVGTKLTPAPAVRVQRRRRRAARC